METARIVWPVLKQQCLLLAGTQCSRWSGEASPTTSRISALIHFCSQRSRWFLPTQRPKSSYTDCLRAWQSAGERSSNHLRGPASHVAGPSPIQRTLPRYGMIQRKDALDTKAQMEGPPRCAVTERYLYRYESMQISDD